MRIDLGRIRDIPRGTVIAFVILLGGLLAAAWLVKDVAKREKAIELLRTEVDNTQAQADSLPKQIAEPLTAEQLSEKVGPLIISNEGLDEFREQLADAATDNHLDVRKLELKSVPVDPASAAGEDLTLLSLQITKYVLVTIEFQATYENAAKFMGALEQLPQRVLIKGAELRRDSAILPKISGTVTLQVYQNNS